MKRKIQKYLIIPIVTAIAASLLYTTGCKKDSGNSAKLPEITTSSASSITAGSAAAGGYVSSDGGAAVTARGVCWGTNPTPDISGNKTTNGTGTGIFSVTLSGLYQGTTYYVRAYATNSAGTTYGFPQSFTTGYLPYKYSYFPIAVWMQPPLKSAILYKANGINTFTGVWDPLDENQWTAIKNAGLRLICSQNDFALSLGNDTLLIGYHMEDEPDNAQWNATTQKYDPCLAPSYIINEYNTLKQKDPSRKIFLGLGQGVAYNNYIGRGACRNNIDMYKASNNGYLTGCDIAAFDIYPINNTDGITNQNLEYVAIGIQNLINWSGGNKPCWCWIETTRIHDTGPRRPDPWEVKSEVWMGIIHGAKGFGYFCHSFVTGATDESALLHDAEMIGAVKLINDQINALAAVLNSPTTTGYATVSSSNSLDPVDIMTKNFGGANYIFAIAMRRDNTTATFTVSSGANIEVFGEGRSITVSNGKFSDTFSPYAFHIYKITNP
jgi:hypothetical protein